MKKSFLVMIRFSKDKESISKICVRAHFFGCVIPNENNRG